MACFLLSCMRRDSSVWTTFLLLIWTLHSVQGFDHSEHMCSSENGYFLCLDSSACVPLSDTCDGRRDCLDGSDEASLCRVNCTTSTSLSCAYKCRNSPHGPMCFCPSGFRIDNNTLCLDVDECEAWPPLCDQKCDNSVGSYLCSCLNGYSLDDSRSHCKASPVDTVEGAYLIFTQRNVILKISLASSSPIPSVVHQSSGLITALAFDISEAMIYFYDMEENVISSVNLNTGKVLRVITNGLGLVSSLAFDWLGVNLYIADVRYHQIVTCSLTTVTCAKLPISNVQVPRSLAIDSQTGKLYWSDCGSSRRIVVSSLNGDNSKVLVEDEVMLRCATSLRIDIPRETIYWVDPELHTIGQVRTDGTGRKISSSPHFKQPFGVDVFEGKIYWSNVIGHLDDSDLKGYIATTNKFTLTEEVPTVLVSNLFQAPLEMHIFHAVLQRYGRNPCAHSLCSEICLLKDQFSCTCACPTGTILRADNHTCEDDWNQSSLVIAHRNHLLHLVPGAVGGQTFEPLIMNDYHNITAVAFDSVSETVYFAETFHMTRNGVKSTTGNIKTFKVSDAGKVRFVFEETSLVTAIAIDWISRNIYWVDYNKEAIEVARLDGSSRMVLLGGPQSNYELDKPRALAVDPFGRRLYFSDCGLQHRVSVCDLIADDCRRSFLDLPIGCISSMFIDQTDGRIYFADSRLGLISSADLNGNDVQPLRHSLEPVSLTVLGEVIYWTDAQFQDLLYQTKKDETGDLKSRIFIGFSPLDVVISLDKQSQPHGENECSQRNGGCSDICIPGKFRALCLCPAMKFLQRDGKTCDSFNREHFIGIVWMETDKKQTVKDERTSTPRNDSITHLTSASDCFSGLICRNGGTCRRNSSTGPTSCSCTSEWSGAQCETARNSTAAVASLPLRQPNEHNLWAPAVFVAVVIIMIIASVLWFVCKRKRKQSADEISSFGSRRLRCDGVGDEFDEPGTMLVVPSYENPAYDDVDTDVVDNDDGTGFSAKMICISSSLESIDSPDFYCNEFL